MSKRSKLSIIKAFYEVLKDGKPHSFNEIATQIETSWETIKNWAELIKFIQEQPKIKLIQNKLNLVIIDNTT